MLPALMIGATVLGGVMKSKAQSDAGAFQQQQYNYKAMGAESQADATQAQGEAAAQQTQYQANLVRESMNPAIATAQAATYNAAVARQQAQLTLEVGAEKERRYRRDAEGTIAEGRAAASASGIELSGSILDVLASNAANAELNALTIRHESVIQSQAYLNTATLEEFEAAQATATAKNIGARADYIDSTAPYVKAQYDYAAGRQRAEAGQLRKGGEYARDAGSSAAASTLLDSGTKLLGMSGSFSASGGSSSGAGELLGSGWYQKAKSAGRAA